MSGRDETGDYFHIIKRGLGSASKPRRVVVIGAGMAGLTAAYELHRAGHRVVVLEARNRVGGRILTLRAPFADGLYAEAGAMRIPRSHKLVRAYIGKLLSGRSATIPFVLHSANDCWFFRGRHYSRRLINREKKELSSTFDAAVRRIKADLRSRNQQNLEAVTEKFDNLSLYDYLDEALHWNDEQIEKYANYNGLEAVLNASLLENLRDDVLLRASETFLQIRDGMDRLPRAIAKELPEHLRFGARVTRIVQGRSEVLVEYRCGHETLREKGDYAIVTIPFPVLRHIPVNSLSPEKRRAIRQLYYDSSTKIFFQFRKAFWQRRGDLGGMSVTDLPNRTIHYPSEIGPDGRAVLVASYTWGTDSQRWSSLPENAILNRALDNVIAVHANGKREEKGIRDLFEGATHYSWQSDQFAGGAFAMFQPGQNRLRESIKRTEGRILFAGEHTTENHAWIEGAIESGLRAALEIHRM